MSRPDQSFFLAHFTRNGKNFNGSEGPHDNVGEMSALEKLISILKAKKITAFELPWTNRKAVDYTHEREWRVAKDFPFQYSYVAFVILNSYTEMEQIPVDIVESIGKDKFIFMDTYRKIEELWPTHLME